MLQLYPSSLYIIHIVDHACSVFIVVVNCVWHGGISVIVQLFGLLGLPLITVYGCRI